MEFLIWQLDHDSIAILAGLFAPKESLFRPFLLRLPKHTVLIFCWPGVEKISIDDLGIIEIAGVIVTLVLELLYLTGVIPSPGQLICSPAKS